MFTQNKTTNSSKVELANFIEEQDIYNSLFLAKLREPGLARVVYTVDSHLRPDLVAADFYGDEAYEGIVLLQAESSMASFKKGSTLKLLPKSTIDGIISGL